MEEPYFTSVFKFYIRLLIFYPGSVYISGCLEVTSYQGNIIQADVVGSVQDSSIDT